MVKKVLYLLFIAVFTISYVNAQEPDGVETEDSAKIEQPQETQKVLTPPQRVGSPFNFTSDREYQLSKWVLLFSFGVLFLETVIILFINYWNQMVANRQDPDEKKRYIVGPNVTKLFGVTLIIVTASILIISGFSADEIAPIVGLLGTIAGYLLGKSEAKPSLKDQT
jgi:hypothetical protein